MRMWAKRSTKVCFALAILASVAGAQEKSPQNSHAGLAAYDLKRETTLLGTVESYTAAAPSAPLGAHVVVQTSGGLVDVHLGDARFLTANKLTIQNGDSLRIIGENVAFGKGTQFVARIVQKGTQALAVRSVAGYPLSYLAPRDGASSKAHGGVL